MNSGDSFLWKTLNEVNEPHTAMSILFSSFVDLFSMMGSVFSAVFSVWFLIFPPLFFFLFKTLWQLHVEDQYASTLKWVLLEIIPPRDIEKSPQLMESIFSGFAGVMKTTTVPEEWIKGEFPASFSLEIASLEGRTHMYVRTQVGFRNLVEAHFYAQYPDIEIVEVPDYVNLVPKTVPNKDWNLWGADFGFVKDDLYPIKTYKYFEESVTGKMIDPLAGMFEVMGKIGPGQHLWFQIIASPYSEKWQKKGQVTVDEFLGKVKEEKAGVFMRLLHDLKDVFLNLGKGMMGREVTFASSETGEKKDEAPVEFRLTPGEKDVLKALQANLGKQMFRSRVRFVYVARREVYHKPTGVSAFIGAIKQFNDFNLNSLKPTDISKTYAHYIFVDSRVRYRQRRHFNRYIRRNGDPSHTKIFLSSEELATLFHIPDMVATAPSLTRVVAKRSNAPSNLPIQEPE